eukprot:3593611-Pleurochrysis_carterae.AAC.1
MRTRGALALRSPSSWILARDGRRCPVEPPPRATAQARPSPRACACSEPPTTCIYVIVVAPARPDGRSGKIPRRESDW